MEEMQVELLAVTMVAGKVACLAFAWAVVWVVVTVEK